MTELLHQYLKNKPHISTSRVKRYGTAYLHVPASDMDDLCEWVEKLCEEHSQVGIEAFHKGK